MARRSSKAAASRRISRHERDLSVETDNRTLTAGAVVVTAGSWSGQIEIGKAQQRCRSVPSAVRCCISRGESSRALRRVTWGDHCYLVPWDDGTVLVGATMEEVGFDEKTTTAGVQTLLDAACELVPHVRDAAFLGARVRAFARAPRTRCRSSAGRGALPNLMYATGHFRNGVLLAPLTAQLVADAILAGRVDPALEAIGPERFGEL